MSMAQLPSILHYLRRLREADERTPVGDRDLLHRFVRDGDEAAFTELVQRHGSMVLGVCRRVLGDWQECEDAFQTTFLVLVRKAAFLRKPDALGPWLHGVALRTALKARSLATRRGRQQPLQDLAAPESDAVAQREMHAILDDAINRLPAVYRTAVILCDLEGMSHAQVARQLGSPTSTISTRLVRARARLRSLLVRRGLAISACFLASGVAARASALVPPALLRKALAAASGTLSPAVALLLKGVCKGMFLANFRVIVFVVAGLAALGLGTGALAFLDPAKPGQEQPALPPPMLVPPAPGPENPRPAQEERPFTLRTTNFEVHAPTRRIAQLIGAEAERQRKATALRWLGKEMDTWTTRCSINVTLTTNGAGGATSFAFDQGRVHGMDMHIEGALDQLLTNTLPHEITHTVLAHHFRCPLPRWADEGAATLSEDQEEQQGYARLAQQIVKAPGRAIPLERLLVLKDFPSDVLAFYGESHALTRFLVQRKGHNTFLQFVGQGMKGNWDKALGKHYGIENVAALEKAWLADLRRQAKDIADLDAANKDQLPRSAAPQTHLAVVDQDGRLRLRQPMPTVVYQPVSCATLPVRDQASYVPKIVVKMQESVVDLQSVKAFRTDGQPIDTKKLRQMLAKEQAVLVSADGKAIEPFYLRVIKEGTLILVRPPKRATHAAAAPTATLISGASSSRVASPQPGGRQPCRGDLCRGAGPRAGRDPKHGGKV